MLLFILQHNSPNFHPHNAQIDARYFHGSCDPGIQYSLGVTSWHWIFLFSQSKVSDANIGIIAILVHLENKSIVLICFPTNSSTY